jgi:hypothetical protein
MKRIKQLWLVLAIFMLPMTAAFAIDRLLLAPNCPDCHAEMTEQLPLFDGTQDGLVRIRANSMEFRARAAGFGNPQGVPTKNDACPEPGRVNCEEPNCVPFWSRKVAVIVESVADRFTSATPLWKPDVLS